MPISDPGIPGIPSWAYQPQTAATDPATDPQNPPQAPLSDAETTCAQSTDSSNNATPAASTPIGDPLVTNMMKAKLDACMPLPGASAAPPKITQADISKGAVKVQTPGGANPATGITAGQVRDLVGIGAVTTGAVADGIAKRAAAKAVGATVSAAAETGGAAAGAEVVAAGASFLGGLVAIGAAFSLGSDIREALDAPGKQRDDAIQRMQGDMSAAAHDLINQKFPGDGHDLNEQGKQQATQIFNNWKDQTGDKLDSVLKDYQEMQGKNRIEGSHVQEQKLNEIEGVANQGIVDLANSLMNVYSDPRNWDQSQSAGVSKK